MTDITVGIGGNATKELRSAMNDPRIRLVLTCARIWPTNRIRTLRTLPKILCSTHPVPIVCTIVCTDWLTLDGQREERLTSSLRERERELSFVSDMIEGEAEGVQRRGDKKKSLIAASRKQLVWARRPKIWFESQMCCWYFIGWESRG